jgi:hypothetical protein
MSGPRELGKRVLPSRTVAWYRRARRRVFRTFGGPVTPASLAKVGARKTGLTRLVRGLALRVLPYETIDRIRRRRLLRSYLRVMSYELVPDPMDASRPAGTFTRRDAFYARVAQEDLERTDIVLQGIDRRIEAISARATERLAALHEGLDLLERELRSPEEAPGAPLSAAG